MDHYKYLDFQINSEMIGNNNNFAANNLELKKYLDFVGQEMIYTNYSLARMQRIEDQISKEYFTLMKTFNLQPLHYDDWIYYTKDPQLTSKSIFDLYRVRLKKNTVFLLFLKLNYSSTLILARPKSYKGHGHKSNK